MEPLAGLFLTITLGIAFFMATSVIYEWLNPTDFNQSIDEKEY